MNSPKCNRRWFQFSVRTLFIVVTLCAILCSWLAVEMEQARRRHEATVTIEKLGGRVLYDWEMHRGGKAPRRPEWLTSVFGDDFFECVYCVDLFNSVTQAELEDVKVFRQLIMLRLYDTRISNFDKTKLQEALPQCEILEIGYPY